MHAFVVLNKYIYHIRNSQWFAFYAHTDTHHWLKLQNDLEFGLFSVKHWLELFWYFFENYQTDWSDFIYHSLDAKRIHRISQIDNHLDKSEFRMRYKYTIINDTSPKTLRTFFKFKPHDKGYCAILPISWFTNSLWIYPLECPNDSNFQHQNSTSDRSSLVSVGTLHCY